jgi:16S rRNA (cytosine1402-N4)-methyltransferase
MHKPVMLEEVLRLSERPEISLDQPLRIWDATFGRGGHTRAFLQKFPAAKVIATDRDPTALEYGEKEFSSLIQTGRLELRKFNFHAAQAFENDGPFSHGDFDLILMDLGVSSPQLDDPDRGFSFYHDGPLDMRMDPSQGAPAHEVVNTWTEVGLQRVFTELGEIPRPHRVVKAIMSERRERPFTTTAQLSQLIERVEGWRKKGRHPATQYFLALRLLVNEELDGLKESLPVVIEKALRPGGRLLVITFHSLEDRIVKNIFKERKDLGVPVNKKVIVPSREEILDNPRSRSAKLRVFSRGETL